MKAFIALIFLFQVSQVHGADAVVWDEKNPKPDNEKEKEAEGIDHQAELEKIEASSVDDCNCRSEISRKGPDKIPIGKIERVRPASVSSRGFNWKPLLYAGLGAAAGFGAVWLYNKWKDSRDNDYARYPYPTPGYPGYAPPVLPPSPPPIAPYRYSWNYSPYRSYLYGSQNPPHMIRANPGYTSQPAFLGNAPAVLPYIPSGTTTYPTYPVQNYFGTQVPNYYPTYNYSGSPYPFGMG